MKDYIRRMLGMLAVAITAGVLVASGAQAQDQAQIDDSKLDSFVVAARAVHEVIQDSAAQINDVSTDEEVQQLRQEIDTKVEAVINDTDGITLDEYKEIHEAARANPELEDRIIQRFNEGGAPVQ